MMKITNLMPDTGKSLVHYSGKEFISKIGIDIIRTVIAGILCGENVRDLTEEMTKKRIHLINGAMFTLYLQGRFKSENFIDGLPDRVLRQTRSSSTKDEKAILNFLLGLTEKGVQNILRSDSANIKKYLKAYKQSLKESADECSNNYGNVEALIELNGKKAKVDWPFFLSLFSAIGAQTLSIRGSEKSLYGKTFERLVLGSLLSLLGFNYIKEDEAGKKKKVFWLSSRGDKRESDATLLYKPGKAVRFDIGFIGPGNTEISLDKVTRYQNELTTGEYKHYSQTFIIVDRIGKKSRIEGLARDLGGCIIQMSMSFWPKLIASELHEKLGYKHEIVDLPESKIDSYIRRRIGHLDLNRFL